MKNRLLKFAESLDHTSKAIQIASGSAELAVEAMKKCITDAQIIIDEVTLAKHTIDEKDAEISKLQSELARCREENQRLWDENVSIRVNLDAANKKYIAEHSPAVPVMNKEEAIMEQLLAASEQRNIQLITQDERMLLDAELIDSHTGST